MFWKILLVLSILPTASAQNYQIRCNNNTIKYQDVFKLFKHSYQPAYSRILVNLMHKCSRRPPPKITHSPQGTGFCRGNLAGFYTSHNHRITLCYRPKQTKTRQILFTLVHEVVHSLQVDINTRPFWRKWLRWELARVKNSVNTVHPLHRDDKIHEEELMAYSLERYARYIFDGNRQGLQKYTPTERKLFELILSGKYH